MDYQYVDYSAQGKLERRGKVNSIEKLDALKQDFIEFHSEHTIEAIFDDMDLHNMYVALIERLEFYAHFVDYSTTRNCWMIENICGENSWMEFNPEDYFDFV